jgi:hypothetical protein
LDSLRDLLVYQEGFLSDSGRIKSLKNDLISHSMKPFGFPERPFSLSARPFVLSGKDQKPPGTVFSGP